MEIVHFAHEHPLTLKKLEEDSYCCNACGLYVLSSPCYICTSQGCNFYVHQACAQLPPESHHYFHSDKEDDPVVKHALDLREKPRDENCLCGECGKLCKNFTYHCSKCEFFLHPLCKFPLDIQIKHISHPQHPIVVVCKDSLLLCDVCGREHKGYFYSCHKCNFWIHQDCALLPSIIKVEKHHHGLSLIYSVASLLDFKIRSRKCLICSKIAIRKFGIYYCFICGIMADVDCATSQMKDLGAILQRDTFLSSTMRTLVKKRAIQESNSTNMLEKYHAHSLLLIDEITQESVCNACIQPISSPYYKCSGQSKCNFFLHEFCADLPLSITEPFLNLVTCVLTSPRSDEFFSLFQCLSCQKYCNGFGYLYTSGEAFGVIDLECVFAPVVIKHDSHKQHPLVIIYSGYAEQLTSCCGEKDKSIYHCSACNFSIHDDCSLLPKTIIHKFDKHPLTLIFTSSSQHHTDSIDHICEFCEEDIDSKYWFYRCAKCDQSFHVDCIPSVGEYSKIKFGGTVKVPCHNDHPLTLVRTLSVGSQTCGYCQDIIEGFKDGMALHCADCNFWIHFTCGYRSWGGIVSYPYRILSG